MFTNAFQVDVNTIRSDASASLPPNVETTSLACADIRTHDVMIPSIVKAFDSLHWAASKAALTLLARLSSSRAIKAPTTVVVIRNGFFGDFVVAIPALRRLRKAFPQTRIVYLTATSFAQRWKNHPQDDNLFQIEPGLIDKVVRYTSRDLLGASSRASLGSEVMADGSTVTIALGYSGDTLRSRLKRVMLCFALGLPFPLGLTGSPTLPMQHQLNRWRVARTDIAHMCDAALASVDEALLHCGVPKPMDTPPERHMPTHPEVHRWLIGVAPFTKQEVKQWPLERFAEVMQTLSSQMRVQFEIYGAPAERDEADRFDRMLDPGIPRESLCGQLTPFQLRQRIESLDLLLCLDSGPAHVASLVGTPVVAVFSQITLHSFWRPWGEAGTLLSASVPCTACNTLNGHCPEGTKACIDGVSTNAVLQKVRSALKAKLPA